MTDRALICCVNDTPERHAEMQRARNAGYDVVHIPPPPPWDDWEQYSRVFGKDKRTVRRYLKKVLRKLGREDLLARIKP